MKSASVLIVTCVAALAVFGSAGVGAISAAPSVTSPGPVSEPTGSALPSDGPAAAPSAAPSSAVPDDIAAGVRARDWFGRLQRGALDRTQLTRDLSDGLRADSVASLAQVLGPLGPPQHFSLRAKHVEGPTADWVFHVTWPQAAFAYTFGIDRATGKIDELYVAPDAS